MTLAITLFAFSVAGYAQLFSDQNVFTLTQFAWAGMGAAFGPILLLLSLRQSITQAQALAMIGAGLSTVIIWRLSDLPLVMFNDGFAGVAAAFLVWAGWRLWRPPQLAPKRSPPVRSRPRAG